LAEAAGERGPQPTLSQLGVTSPAKLKGGERGGSGAALPACKAPLTTVIHTTLPVEVPGVAKTWDVKVGEAGENSAPVEGVRGKRGNCKAPAATATATAAAITTTSSRANSRGKAGAR